MIIKTILEKGVDLLEKSVLTRFTLVLLTFGPLAYLYLVQAPVPDTLEQVAMLILGYFLKSVSVEIIKKG